MRPKWRYENSEVRFYGRDCITIRLWYPWPFPWYQVEQQNCSATYGLDSRSREQQYQTLWNKNDANSVRSQDHDVLLQQPALEQEVTSLNQKCYWHCFLSAERVADFGELRPHFMHQVNQKHQRTDPHNFLRFRNRNFRWFHSHDKIEICLETKRWQATLSIIDPWKDCQNIGFEMQFCLILIK